MNPGKLRLFVAVPLPEEVRGKIAMRIGKRKQAVSFRKMGSIPEDLHITLHFLGACSRKAGEQVKERLRELAPTMPFFRLKLGPLGSLRRSLQSADSVERGGRGAGALASASSGRGGRTVPPRLSRGETLLPAPSDAGQELPAAGLLPSRGWSRYGWRRPRGRKGKFDGSVWYRSHLGRTPMYAAAAVFELQGGREI